MSKIVLIGYMGVGKTTLAKLLAEQLKVNWLDLDELIEKETQLSISSLFQQKGEVYFRKLEHNLFTKIMQSSDSFVLSTGGGTPCYANNHLLLNGDGIASFYLKASIPTLYNRLHSATANRPLLTQKSEEELLEAISKNLFDRAYYYNQATYKIVVDDKSPTIIVEEMVGLLH
jgi:shikimate kinase